MIFSKFVPDFIRPPSTWRMMLGALVLILAVLVIIPSVSAAGSLTGIGSISGTPRIGNTLTAGSVSPSGATYTLQWRNCTSTSSSTCSDIPGATSNTYVPILADYNMYIRVNATGTGSYTGMVQSNSAGPVTKISVTNIGNPTGTLRAGNTLTAGALTPSAATVNYQWREATSQYGSYSDIGGATSSTYLLLPSDEGMWIRVVATGTDSYTGTVTSGRVGPVQTPLTAIGAPTGTTQYNSWLTAGVLTPSNANVDYQWEYAPSENGPYSPISSATSQFYRLRAGDVGMYIEVYATGIDGYYGTVNSTAVGPITTIPVTAIGSTTGTVQVTHTLTAGSMTPSGATGHVLYQWQNSSVLGGTFTDITGATSNTYDLGPDDMAKYYQVVVTGDITEGYSGTVTSTPVGPVAPAPITAIGSTTGTAQVTHTLTAGGLTPSEATVTYQWQNATSAAGPYAPISGATSSTYALGADDLNKYYQVVATGTGAYFGIVTSTAKGPVAPAPFTAFGPITGTAWTGNILTAGTLTPSDVTVTYQWQNATAENGPYTPISGAISSTYVLSKDDLGRYYEVVATAHGAYFGAINSTAAGPITMPPPTVTAISPIDGTLAGGNLVTIVGTNFYGTPTVTFGATPGTGVIVVSETTITAISPAGSAGTVDVTVTTPSTTSGTSTLDQFTYYANPPSEIGVFRNGKWYLDANANGTWDSSPLDKFYNSFGSAGDIPVVGDWNNDGISKAGIFRNGIWYVDWNNNGVWDATDIAHIMGPFGQAGDIPVTGDWDGTKIKRIGVFRNGMWYVDWNNNGVWDATDAAHIKGPFGQAGDLPVAGDWTGDGITKIGVFRNGMWYVDWNNNGVWDATDVLHTKGPFGQSGDKAVVGKWS